MCKFHDVSISRVLREINFGNSAKSAFFNTYIQRPWILILINLCKFWRLKFTKLAQFRAPKIAKNGSFRAPKLISRKSEWQKNLEITWNIALWLIRVLTAPQIPNLVLLYSEIWLPRLHHLWLGEKNQPKMFGQTHSWYCHKPKQTGDHLGHILQRTLMEKKEKIEHFLK